MIFLRVFFLLYFPLFLFASPLSDQYAESFMDHFQKGDFSESMRLLDEWKMMDPIHEGRIVGMKAAVYLATGDFEKSKILMNRFIQGLSFEELSDPTMNFVLQFYYKIFSDSSFGLLDFQKIGHLCKQDQLTGG